jgi:hypothetical protein
MFFPKDTIMLIEETFLFYIDFFSIATITSGPLRQTKRKKHAFKHYKNSSRLWMPIVVPDCHPKTPKINKHENKKYFTVLDIRA